MFLQRFVSRSVSTLRNTKVSEKGGSEALFLELIDDIRKNRLDKDPEIHRRPSDIIHRMTAAETEITRTLFGRLSEGQKTTEELVALREHNIDPYWDPFALVQETRDKVVAEYHEYAGLATSAEAKKARIKIKRALAMSEKTYDSFSDKFRALAKRPRDFGPPKPHRILEQFWEPSGLHSQLNREKITWKDVDILQHFRATNGYILPRRSTQLSKKNHKAMSKAIKIARHMALIPKKWNSNERETMPLMDPMQWMVDRLSKRVERGYMSKHELEGVTKSILDKKIGSKRAEAMLRVLMGDLAPELNYSRFIKHMQANAPQLEDVDDSDV